MKIRSHDANTHSEGNGLGSRLTGETLPYEAPLPGLLMTALLAAMAGGMGWGIRGQYGHETGAMVPGVLVALVLVFLSCPHASSLRAARAVALMALAFGFGGSMTYGQTVGLTHDHELVGNWEALRWGMLGLFIKGGIWIGFAGAFLGIGLGRKKYSALEILTLMATLVGFYFLGRYLLNEPFRPFGPDRVLPQFYFSDHWVWEPDKVDMKPRRESWGGLLLALAALFVYVGWFKKDRLARNMTLVGVLSGGLGFTLGQSVQASWQWEAEFLRKGFFAEVIFAKVGNWWNMMETTFGLVMGFGLGVGVWLNRRLIEKHDTDGPVEPALTSRMEWVLAAVYAGVLVHMDFQFTNPVLAVGAVPLVFIVGGRYFPYLQALPLLALPIAAKTLRARGDLGNPDATPLDILAAWSGYFVLPMAIMLATAIFFARRGRAGRPGRSFTRWALILSAWMYFSLNFAFWGSPEMKNWSGPGWIFVVCVLSLTLAALFFHRRPSSESEFSIPAADASPEAPGAEEAGGTPSDRL